MQLNWYLQTMKIIIFEKNTFISGIKSYQESIINY
jgi:hypothetical protein